MKKRSTRQIYNAALFKAFGVGLVIIVFSRLLVWLSNAPLPAWAVLTAALAMVSAFFFTIGYFLVVEPEEVDDGSERNERNRIE